jgi:hypothetical protein
MALGRATKALRKATMARPEYEDATAGGEDEQPSTAPTDATGWLQHGQEPAPRNIGDTNRG